MAEHDLAHVDAEIATLIADENRREHARRMTGRDPQAIVLVEPHERRITREVLVIVAAPRNDGCKHHGHEREAVRCNGRCCLSSDART